MSLNLTDDEIHGLIDYARDKFAAERYPLAPVLRPIRGSSRQARPETKVRAALGEEVLRAEYGAQ